MINLISDTVTKPTPAMLQAMMTAEVGDDVFQQDPTINALEAKAAAMFGMEDALFCPSGTMTNQIAINIHTQPLDELICDENSHVYQYELGGYSFHSGVSICLLKGINGKIKAEQIAGAIKPAYDWMPVSKLVVLENTCNKGGGSFYTLGEIRPIKVVCDQNNLKLHLDGARLFNALVETGESPNEVGELFDSISICLSKGLGAPVGSLLIGKKVFIKRARKIRKVMGGGMRQAGFLAAAGIYALDYHIDRLKKDNDNAKKLGAVLSGLSYVENVRPVQTNIVIFDVKAPYTSSSFLALLETKGIQAAPFGPMTVRFCTHLDVSDDMIAQVLEVLEGIK
ncbi:MAG: threonine aldolase [Saprospiraceae bacterium]|jgi:threonine aldolase